MKKQILYSLLLALVTWQCSKTENNPQPLPESEPDIEVNKVALMNQELGWKLFKEERLASPGENILISPYSVQTALFMAQNGAQGSTLSQMLDIMGGTDCTVEELNEFHSDLNTDMVEQSGQPDLSVVNAYFYDDRRISVESSFLAAISEHYEAETEILDFSESEASVEQINDWVKTQTNEKIEELLDRINPEDIAFIINALYFRADWAIPFPESDTDVGIFTKADGTETEVEFMHNDNLFTTAITDEWHMIDLPFKDSTFSLSLIRPSENNMAEGWPNTITPKIWNALYEELTYGRAIVSFPKLKLEYDNHLVSSLKALGMIDAFEPDIADFSSMGNALIEPNIFINKVIHKSVLEVDENGVEGAAATGVGFVTSSVPPIFTFNCPFVLVLRHVPTNCMLFTGFVADPAFD